MAERKPHPTHLLRYDWESSVTHRTTSQQKKAGLASYKREVKAATELDLARDLVDSGEYDHGGIYAKTPYFTYLDYVGSGTHKKYIDNPLGQRAADKKNGLKRVQDASRKRQVKVSQPSRSVLKYRTSPNTSTKVKGFIAYLIKVANNPDTSNNVYEDIKSIINVYVYDDEIVGNARPLETLSIGLIEWITDLINLRAVSEVRGLYDYGLATYRTGLLEYLTVTLGGTLNQRHQVKNTDFRESNHKGEYCPYQLHNTIGGVENLFFSLNLIVGLANPRQLSPVILDALLASGVILEKSEPTGINGWAFRNHSGLTGTNLEVQQVKFATTRIRYISASGLSFDSYKPSEYRTSTQRLWDHRKRKSFIEEVYNEGLIDKPFYYSRRQTPTVSDVNTYPTREECERAKAVYILEQRNNRRRYRRNAKAKAAALLNDPQA